MGTILLTVAACTAVLSVVAWFVAGPIGLTAVLISSVACGVPAVACSVVSQMLKPLQSLLFGTIGRMTFAMTVVIATRVMRPELGMADFYVWILVFYLVTLFADTVVLLRPTVSSSEAA